MLLTSEEGWLESVVSVCPHLSSPWCLEEDASLAFPSHLASSGPAPILLSAASSPSRAPFLSPAPFLAGASPSRDGLVPSLDHGSAPEGRDRVHAPAEMGVKCP